MLFAKFLGEKDIAEVLMKPSVGGAAPVGRSWLKLINVAAGAVAAEGAAEAAEEKKEEEEEEEEEVDMSGGGLFGDDDDDW